MTISVNLYPEIGQLNEYIEIQSRSESPAANGYLNETFTPVGNYWAMVMPIGELKKLDSSFIGDKPSHIFYVVYDGQLNDRLWIYWNSNRYDVLGYNVINEANWFIEMMATKVQ